MFCFFMSKHFFSPLLYILKGTFWVHFGFSQSRTFPHHHYSTSHHIWDMNRPALFFPFLWEVMSQYCPWWAVTKMEMTDIKSPEFKVKSSSGVDADFTCLHTNLNKISIWASDRHCCTFNHGWDFLLLLSVPEQL